MRHWKGLFLFMLGLFFIVQTVNYSSSVFEPEKKAIYADAAGYYVYLPCTFLYGFENDNIPHYLLPGLGNGFRVDEGKVITKYPYGVALLSTPAFIVAHTLALIVKTEANGFSELYQKAICISGMLYLFAGLFFMYQYLRFFFKSRSIMGGIFFLLSGTNLYYYAMYAPGMSHIYSFFLFSLLLFLVHTHLKGNHSKSAWQSQLGIPVVISLIFIVRHLNIVFVPFVFLVCIQSHRTWQSQKLFEPRQLFIFLTVFALFVLPQLIYNQFAYGDVFVNTYANESFVYLSSPKLIQFWFSPLNGMFLYNPMLLFVIACGVYEIFKKKLSSVFILLCFLLFSYLYASWFSWFLGCSFGCRAVVDILPMIGLPFFSFLSHISSSLKKVVVYTSLIFLACINMNTLSSFEYCFNGHADWDWFEFKKEFGEGKIMKAIFGKNLMLSLMDRQSVAIKCHQQSYWTTSSEREEVIIAKPGKPYQAEIFNIIRVDGRGRILLQNAQGNYLSADAGRNDTVSANRKIIGRWEVFTLHRLTGDTIAIESFKGKFLKMTSQDSPHLIAGSERIGKEEKFTIKYRKENRAGH